MPNLNRKIGFINEEELSILITGAEGEQPSEK